MRISGVLLIFIVSCNSVEKSELKSCTFDSYDESVKSSELIINEYSPKGTLVSQSGEESDWIELYNSTDSLLTIKKGEWFLSDDENDTEKFPLPAMSIEPHGFILLWCDGNESNSKEIHTNFKISSDSEAISLYHNNELQDQISCNEDLKKKFSFGRESDGQNSWTKIKNPSPGRSNNLFENYAETAH